MAERLSREALYDLVWLQPMKTLSARFGISDVGLKKTCAKADIPTPDRGYWSKKDAGKDVEQRPLPKRSPGMENEIRVAAGRRNWYEDRRDELLEPLPATPNFATPLTIMQERIARPPSLSPSRMLTAHYHACVCPKLPHAVEQIIVYFTAMAFSACYLSPDHLFTAVWSPLSPPLQVLLTSTPLVSAGAYSVLMHKPSL